ncbi:MAG: DUF3488 domain-containing protein, partial [Gammaproteobacteria bacterium]|nr:DUF3488 domain-containing protein [Gammaproteobacteria bacterium]
MRLWRRSRRPLTLDPSPSRVEDRLTPMALVWLLLTLALAVVPHAAELPVWLAPAFFVIAGWRGFIAIRERPLPPRWVLLALATLATAGVLVSYKTLFGRDAGVTLLAAMTACKLLEARNLRDGVVLVFLGYLQVMSNLLYSQEIPLVVYLLILVTLMLISQMLIHRQHAGLTAWAPVRLA